MANPKCYVCGLWMVDADLSFYCYHTKEFKGRKPVYIQRLWAISNKRIEVELRNARRHRYGNIMTS